MITVFLAMPNLRAIAAFGTPSATSLLINAQSSKVITLRSSKSAHFSSASTAQSSSAVDSPAGSITRALSRSAINTPCPARFGQAVLGPAIILAVGRQRPSAWDRHVADTASTRTTAPAPYPAPTRTRGRPGYALHPEGAPPPTLRENPGPRAPLCALKSLDNSMSMVCDGDVKRPLVAGATGCVTDWVSIVRVAYRRAEMRGPSQRPASCAMKRSRFSTPVRSRYDRLWGSE